MTPAEKDEWWLRYSENLLRHMTADQAAAAVEEWESIVASRGWPVAQPVQAISAGELPRH